MPKRLIASIIVAGLAVVAVFVTQCRPKQQHASSTGSASTQVATASAQAATASAAPSPPETRVRRLSPAEHQQLAERIAAARARARQAQASPTTATPSPALPSSDDDMITIEQVSPTGRKALDDAVPILAECFHDKTPNRTAIVQMMMYSDPSVGMVIDTEQMTDDDGKPLPSELDDCLRTTIESLALPPLEIGGHLPLQYSVRF